MIRKVEVFGYIKQVNGKHEKTKIGEGLFHQFGCNYEEYESGPGNFTTAIIEMLPEREVKNVPVELIRFME